MKTNSSFYGEKYLHSQSFWPLNRDYSHEFAACIFNGWRVVVCNSKTAAISFIHIYST